MEGREQALRTLLVRGSAFLLILVLLDQLFVVFRYRSDNVFAAMAEEKLAQAAQEYGSGAPPAQLLILGSSHAQFGLDPQVLNERLDRSAYNLGYAGGTRIGNHLLMLDAYLEARGEPELLLYAIDVFSLNFKPYKELGRIRPLIGERGSPSGNWLVSRARRLAIWLDDQPPLSAALRFRLHLARYLRDVGQGDWRLPILRSDAETANLEMFSRYEGYELDAHGFVRGFGQLERDFVRYKEVGFRPKQSAALALAEIVALCRTRGIELVLLQLPEHAVALAYQDKYAAFAAWMAEFSAEHRVDYLDLNAPGAFPVEKDALFFDSDHLNAAGAVLAAEQVAEHLLGVGALQ